MQKLAVTRILQFSQINGNLPLPWWKHGNYPVLFHLYLQPTPPIAYSNRWYYHIPLACCQVCFPMIRLMTWWWKPPRDSPIRGVTTHVSESKIMMTCTTDNYKGPVVCLYCPYLPRTCKNCSQVCLAFLRLPTNTGQSLSFAVRVHLRYHK